VCYRKSGHSREIKLKYKNPNWIGNELKKAPIHVWLRRNYKFENKCSICGKVGRVDLASKKHIYTRNPQDYQLLCRSCHMKYDIKMGFRKPHKGEAK
jgi:uncharacterized protein YlaI